MAIIVYTQALVPILPLGSKDPAGRVLGYGWADLAHKIDDMRAGVGAPVVLATDYSLAGELAYYLPSKTAVHQINERIRWVNEPQPDPRLFNAQMIYVCKNGCGYVPLLPQRFRQVEFLGTLPRSRGGVTIEHYSVYRLAGPIGPALSPMYPVRLKGVDDASL